MVLTDFFKNILNVNTTPSGLSAAAGDFSGFQESFASSTIISGDATQLFLSNTPDFISSGAFTQAITNLIKNSFVDVTNRNLIALGDASRDASRALEDERIVRENQRKEDNESAQNRQIQINQLNERLSLQVQELGQSLSELSESFSSGSFDPIKLLTDNPLIGGIGIGGLAVGAVVLLLVLR